MLVSELFQTTKPQFTRIGLGNWLIRDKDQYNHDSQTLMTFVQPRSAYNRQDNKSIIAAMVYMNMMSYRMEAWGNEIEVVNDADLSETELKKIFQHTKMSDWRILTNKEAARYLAEIPTPY